MVTFEHNGEVFNMTEEQIEAAYRFKEHRHRIEDARRQIEYCGYGTDEPDDEHKQYFESRWGFTMEHALTLVEDVIDEFDEIFDCNVAENDLWDTAVMKVLERERKNFRDSRKQDWETMQRTLSLVKERISGIELMRSILDGTCKNETYKGVDKDQVARELKWEQECLLDLIDDIRNGLSDKALKWIEKEFCSEEME